MERLEKWVQHFKEEAIRFGTNSANGKDYAEIAVILEKYEQIQKSIGDDYDLDRLRKLVEADREKELQRQLKRFDIQGLAGKTKMTGCKHDLKPLSYCCDDDYGIYTNLVENESGERMKLKYCSKCGAVFCGEER